jgi:hypothetical protein
MFSADVIRGARAVAAVHSAAWIAFLPVACLSYRATVVMLWIIAATRLLATAREDMRGFGSPIAGAVALCAAASISLTWSAFPGSGLRIFGAEVLTVIAPLVVLSVARAAKLEPPPAKGMLFSFLFACGFLLIEIRSGMALTAATGLHPYPPKLNQIALLLLLFLPAVAACFVGRGMLPALLAIVAAGAAIFAGNKDAAKLGLMAAAAGHIIWRRPRFATFLCSAGVIFAFATTPWWGIALETIVESAHGAGVLKHSAVERIDILKGFGAAFPDRPFFGFGFGSSPGILHDPRFSRAEDSAFALMGHGHPHNGFLQILVEFGGIGAIGAAVAVIAVIRSVRDVASPIAPWAGTLLISVLVVTAVSHGLWQAWWWAGVAAAAELTRISEPRPRSTS